MQDYFIGKRNKKIEEKAIALGIRLFFVKEVSKIEDLKNVKQDSKSYDGVLIKNANTEMMRKLIDKASNYFSIIIVLGINDIINRAALEHRKTTALASPEYSRKNDFMNYRNSGLNQVLCKIAKENNKIIIENFSEILNSDKKTRALLLGRIIQNSRLCKKYKVNFIIRNFSDNEKNLISSHELENFEKVIRQ